MTSMFRTAMGPDFDRLHPALQRRFSVGLDSGEACLGDGVMDEIWLGGAWVRPFLLLGATRNILVPEAGRGVPFSIENVPYVDSFGRESVSFVRTFGFPDQARRFDAQMVLAPQGDRIIDYLGTHQHLAADLHLATDGRGGLVIRSGAYRFREGPVDLDLPPLVTAEALVHETYQEPTDTFHIDVQVTNRWFGPIFGYRGSFRARYLDASTLGVRPGLRPVREECRA